LVVRARRWKRCWDRNDLAQGEYRVLAGSAEGSGGFRMAIAQNSAAVQKGDWLRLL
jgi:hypothetical protein